MENTWSEISNKLAQILEDADYNVWIAPLSAQLAEGKLTVTARNEFVATFISKNYQAVIINAATQVLGFTPQFEVKASAVVSERSERNSVLNVNNGTEAVATPGTQQGSLPLLWADTKRSVKTWQHNFDDFIVGPCNQLAHAAAHAICDTSSALANVLYLCSAPGLGKTHLTQAVGSSLARASNFSNPRIEYLSAEDFSSRFRMSLLNREIEAFKARYRDTDILLLEDVHFLQGKEKTQDELLATISYLLNRGSKVVFTSSFAPKDLGKIDSQLLSRMSGGIIAAINRPNAETRRRIISHKASVHQVLLSDDVTDYIAESMNSDVRQIESCIQNLALKARLFNHAITIQMARETVANYTDSLTFIGMPDIVRLVCEAYGISKDQLNSKSRKQDYVQARNTVFYLARKHTDLSLQEIGREFDRTHSTVIKSITAVERELNRESRTGRQIANTISIIERNGNFPSAQH